MKRKEKTSKQILSDENDDLCYWITVANSKGRDTFDDGELKRPVAVHHLVHKTKTAMIWELDDLFPMKQGNHFRIHRGGEEGFFVSKIIREKGQDWYDTLHFRGTQPYKMNLDKVFLVNRRLRYIFRQITKMGYDEFRQCSEPKDDKDYYRWSVIYGLWRKKEVKE